LVPLLDYCIIFVGVGEDVTGVEKVGVRLGIEIASKLYLVGGVDVG
jgi:hypothetical protein